MGDLKPCPFCGSDLVGHWTQNSCIVCHHCGAEGPVLEGHALSHLSSSAAWNTRATPPEVAEQAEARVAELEAEVERMREASQMAGASLGEEIADLRNGAVCAAVKPLKWEPSIIGKPWHSAKAPWGFYYAQWDDEIGAWFASLEMGEVEAPIILQPSDVETIDAAKAAAQADYERRILSTLTLRSDAELRAEAVSATWSAAIKAETAWSPETNSTPWCLLTVEQMRAFEASTGQMMRLRQDGEWHPHNGNGVGIVSDTYRIRKGGAE